MRPRISRKKIEKLERQGRLRDGFELWVDRHNHKMELVRTLTGIFNIILSSVVLLRVFGLI